MSLLLLLPLLPLLLGHLAQAHLEQLKGWIRGAISIFSRCGRSDVLRTTLVVLMNDAGYREFIREGAPQNQGAGD